MSDKTFYDEPVEDLDAYYQGYSNGYIDPTEYSNPYDQDKEWESWKSYDMGFEDGRKN